MNDLSTAQKCEQIGSLFSDALVEVISKTTGFQFTVASSQDDAAFNELTGFMSLNGNSQGMVFISAGRPAVRMLCSYMTGLSEAEITNADLDDTLCELVNMTAGNAKLRFNAEQLYTLSPPFLLHGQNMSITSKKKVSIVSRTLMGEEISVKMKVVFY